MADKVCFTEIIFLMDTVGNIKKVYFDKGNRSSLKNINDVLDIQSIEVFNDFMSHINKNGLALDYLIGLNIDGTYIKLLSTGVKYENNIILFFFNDLFETIDKELIKINNEQLNTLRLGIKEVANHNSHKYLTEEKMLDEMTQLNNQLITMQRELAKKNIEFKIINDRLNQLSIIDQLTGLYNRRHFFNNINEEMLKAENGNYKLGLVSIDLNNFKKINDDYGHDEGDRVLREFAKTAQMHLRRNIDLIYRFGGDEFIILLLDFNISYAEKVVEELNYKVNSIHDVLSLSYGIVEIITYENIDVENLLAVADKKMYEYKRQIKKSKEQSN